jgi:phosphate-selective porin OprO and OprP
MWFVCNMLNPNSMSQRLFLFVLLSFVLVTTYGQTQPAVTFYAKKQRGYGLVTKDSTFSLNFQFRMQNRAAVITKGTDDLDPDSFEFRVRRLRLKFEGFAYNPKLTYYIQLSFSRGDMDWRANDNSVVNNSPNVVRDAVIYYSPSPKFRFGFGQTKLPGNRQRVISSGDQQFADRSIVNATFNIDRDFGFFGQYTGSHFIFKGAITSGEGRNSVSSNSGLAYTGRVEFLPFGKFTGTNDYQEGDLEREPTPKLSMAATYCYNEKVMRQAGQLGNDTYANPSIDNLEFDVLFKYAGFAFYNEYMNRNSTNPITVNSADPTKARIIYDGKGFLSQASYLFKNNYEIAARYSKIIPSSDIYQNTGFDDVVSKDNLGHEIQQIEAGVTKYLNGHRVKIQGNIVYNTKKDLLSNTTNADDGFWSAIFQFEIGI